MTDTSTDDAFRKVEGLVRELYGRDCLRLPTQSEMAAVTGLSYHAVQRVVRSMREAGILRVSRRAGIHVNPSGMTPDGLRRARDLVTANISHAWERIAEQLSEEIRAGAIQPGEQLPSYKSLCARFGVEYRTVRHALDALERTRLIERHQRGFRVRQSRTEHSCGVVVLITVPKNPHVVAQFSVNSAAFWDTFDHECARLRVRAEMFGHDPEGNLARFDDPGTYSVASIMKRFPVLGFIVWGSNMDRRRFTRLMDGLRTTGKPVSVLVEALDSDIATLDELVSICRGTPRTAVFPLMIDADPGARAARFLYDQGHRSVALFSPRYPALQTRAQGVREALSGLHVELAEHWLDLPPCRRQIASERIKQLKHGEYSEAFARIHDLNAWLGQQFSEYSQVETSAMVEALNRDIAYGEWKPVFERALAECPATAWIGASDPTALAALRFLRERSVRVPGAMSVIGFDNSLTAFIKSLTSLDFNMRAATTAMFAHLLEPPSAPRGDIRVHYTPGFIVERSSTRARQPR